MAAGGIGPGSSRTHVGKCVDLDLSGKYDCGESDGIDANSC